jgi:hypothetical protein
MPDHDQTRRTISGNESALIPNVCPALAGSTSRIANKKGLQPTMTVN